MTEQVGTVTVRETESGFVATEAQHRFLGQAQLDRGLVVLAGVLAVAAPVTLLGGSGHELHVAASAGLLGAAALAFLVSRRGTRKRITLDLSAGALQIETLSAAGSARGTRTVPLDEIDSIVVHRARGPSHAPELRARMRRSAAPLVILRGAREELEQLNLRLCTDHSVAQMAAQLGTDTASEPRQGTLFAGAKAKPRRVVGAQASPHGRGRSRRPAPVDGFS